MVKEVSGSEEFEKEVLKSDKAVVDFWAPWCGPCQMLAPIFEKISKQVDAKFVKVNVDENQDVASANAVMGIPCMIVYKNGEEASRITGFKEEADFKKEIEEALQ